MAWGLGAFAKGSSFSGITVTPLTVFSAFSSAVALDTVIAADIAEFTDVTFITHALGWNTPVRVALTMRTACVFGIRARETAVGRGKPLGAYTRSLVAAYTWIGKGIKVAFRGVAEKFAVGTRIIVRACACGLGIRIRFDAFPGTAVGIAAVFAAIPTPSVKTVALICY